jgi:HAMP domain-containing protein
VNHPLGVAPGANLTRVRVERDLSPFERAAARFNASEAARTVAGLTRTLGPPKVSIGAAAGAPGEVRITVAWELSWYQWGVDVGDEGRPVFELAKGLELDELDASARQWNAGAVKGGGISPWRS